MSDKRDTGIAKQLIFRAPSRVRPSDPKYNIYAHANTIDTIQRHSSYDRAPYWRTPLTDKHTNRCARKAIVPLRDDD